MLSTFRYLNTQYIKKQKFSDADINYGGFGVELNEQMLEIGEVNSQIYTKGACRLSLIFDNYYSNFMLRSSEAAT